MSTQSFFFVLSSRSFSRVFIGATLAAATFSVIVASGCGGGSGGTTNPVVSPTPTPTITPTPTPTITPTPTPSPSSSPGSSTPNEAIARNFQPNYIPATGAEYYRWPSNKNIRVFIRPTVNNKAANVPSSSIDGTRARSIIEQSLGIWSSSTANDFTFTLVDTSDNADIEIGFVDELLNRENNPALGVGITDYNFFYENPSDESKATFTKARIQVKTGFPDSNLIDTTAHEIGHAIGIRDHSNNESDLLYTVSLPPAVSTQRDQNTAFFLYYSPTANRGRSVKRGNTSAQIRSKEIVCPVPR